MAAMTIQGVRKSAKADEACPVSIAADIETRQRPEGVAHRRAVRVDLVVSLRAN